MYPTVWFYIRSYTAADNVVIGQPRQTALPRLAVTITPHHAAGVFSLGRLHHHSTARPSQGGWWDSTAPPSQGGWWDSYSLDDSDSPLPLKPLPHTLSYNRQSHLHSYHRSARKATLIQNSCCKWAPRVLGVLHRPASALRTKFLSELTPKGLL